MAGFNVSSLRLLAGALVAFACSLPAQAESPPDIDALDSAAERWSTGGAGGAPSFVKHVVPLFNKVGCSTRSCHGSFQGQNGFRLSLFGYDPELDHAELATDEGEGPRVNVDDVDASLALRKPLELIEHDGGLRFEPESWQHHVLREWIAAGAPYESETAPYLDRLEVYPADIRLTGDETISLRTVAWFSDGTTEEVTPLTTFSSNDESVALVTDDGVVSRAGAGDTAIVVTYAGGVVTAQVIAPQDSPGPFPEYPAHNEIDRFVAQKLEQVGIHPSELCSDDVFIRRAYVDVIGTLPTADEVRAFLADERPDKRARLIDELLCRPEYAQFWGSFLSDMTGNNGSNVNNFLKVSWLWQSWLEDKLARNVPWDELVGGIVTATSREGRSLEEYVAENEAVAAALEPREGFDEEGIYARRQTLDQYWLKRMSDREKGIAIRTANAFLGLQIQCAECHKHPFDRWTQDDFEGWTSFARVVHITDLDGSERSQGRYDYDKVALYAEINPREERLVREHPPKILGGPVVAPETNDDPRVAMWEWMRAPDNPYFARNIVNRLWAHYFSVGIVDPIDDMNAANPPSNPQLLGWLAEDFIAHGFDLKHLHRRILTSRTYQLSYVPNDSNRHDRRNFSHALVKRMRAEVALDALAQVTGTSLRFNNYASPPGRRAIGLSASARYGNSEYFMTTFGRPERVQTCACERSNEASLAQALFLINDTDLLDRISDSSGRLPALLTETPENRQLIEELYLTCLARYPREDEMETVLAFVDQSESREAAMQDLLWSLINVREFLFVR